MNTAMKRNKFFTPFVLCLAMILFVPGIQHSIAQTYCTTASASRYAGEKDGYRYELWNQNGQGTGCMTLGSGALFSGEWSGILNYLARVGLGYDQTQEHQEIGKFFTTYNCDYNPSSASGNSYLSVYGWTVEPLIEYYIVEDWRNWIPSMDAGATLKGTIDVNGSIYDIYQNTRVNQPSIIGNTTFQQYFSIRRNKVNSGTINISDHFEKWESLGMDMGKMYEVSFVVEGYQSSGNFNFTELDVFVGEDPGTDPDDPDPDTDPVLDVEKSSLNSKVRTYSSPNSGVLSVDLDESVVNASVKVYNVTGSLLFSQDDVNTRLLQVPNLKKGFYLINVNCKKLNYTGKAVIH